MKRIIKTSLLIGCLLLSLTLRFATRPSTYPDSNTGIRPLHDGIIKPIDEN